MSARVPLDGKSLHHGDIQRVEDVERDIKPQVNRHIGCKHGGSEQNRRACQHAAQGSLAVAGSLQAQTHGQVCQKAEHAHGRVDVAVVGGGEAELVAQVIVERVVERRRRHAGQHRGGEEGAHPGGEQLTRAGKRRQRVGATEREGFLRSVEGASLGE